MASQNDRSWTLQRHKMQCMYTKLFYKLLHMSFVSVDGLTGAKTREETGLILLSYVVSITSRLYKGSSLMAWRVHSAHLPVLLSQFEPHKRKRGLTMPEAGDPALRSEPRNISRAPFFRRRCPSEWCQLSLGQQHETQPLIYHIQDLCMPLMSQDIQHHRDKGRAFTEEAVVLLN